MQICNLNESIYGVHELIGLLKDLDDNFNPQFRTRINSFELFTAKLCQFGQVHIACDSQRILGAIGYYCNDIATQQGYITYLAVRPLYSGKGIANKLLKACIKTVRKAGMSTLTVRTDSLNAQAIKFYTSSGFHVNKKMSVDPGTEGKLFFEIGI